MKKEIVYTNIELDEGFKDIVSGLRSGISKYWKSKGQEDKTDTPAQATPVEAEEEKEEKPQPQTDSDSAGQPVSNLQQTIKSSTSDILLPQAILIKSLLTKELGQSLVKVLGGLSQEQRKTIMTPVMQYLNTLPNMASQVIAEQKTPFQPRVAGDDTAGMPARSTSNTQQQAALKTKLASKHAANTKLIGNNLKALQTQMFNNIKTKLNANNVANMLYNSIDKKYGNTKQGMQYIKSLQKNPQAHLDALLAALQVVLDNIMLIIQSSMPKQETPKANLPENKIISESQINRWKVLAEIKK